MNGTSSLLSAFQEQLSRCEQLSSFLQRVEKGCLEQKRIEYATALNRIKELEERTKSGACKCQLDVIRKEEEIRELQEKLKTKEDAIKSLRNENNILSSKLKATEDSTNGSPSVMKALPMKQVIPATEKREEQAENYEVEYFQVNFNDMQIPKKRSRPSDYSKADDLLLTLKEAPSADDEQSIVLGYSRG
eukprot:TRINITY_DN5619_c0_g3_i2.p2 TRINITY_DN5619_c0_g3~~TRINITY_DN5619_c0_g3_i2.p2  ORF type:complete len:190 (+),score=46.54 TRINITY_DN5619_c0_g3_i2:105-674(+)